MTDKERLMDLVGISWTKIPQELWKAARQEFYNGRIEWYEHSKEARLPQKKTSDNMEEVVEDLDAMTTGIRTEGSFDYIEKEFSKLKENDFDGLYKISISDGDGGKTNTLTLDKDSLMELKELLKSSKTYKSHSGNNSN